MGYTINASKRKNQTCFLSPPKKGVVPQKGGPSVRSLSFSGGIAPQAGWGPGQWWVPVDHLVQDDAQRPWLEIEGTLRPVCVKGTVRSVTSVPVYVSTSITLAGN